LPPRVFLYLDSPAGNWTGRADRADDVIIGSSEIHFERIVVPTGNNLKEEIAAANQNLMDVFKHGDAAAAAACYTDDAQFLVPHMSPIVGRQTIEAVWKSMVGHGHTLHFKTLELEGYDSSALDIGQYTRKDSAGVTLDEGKYIVVWKQVAGAWKIHRDMISTNLPKPT